jgi:hypothetical protein
MRIKLSKVKPAPEYKDKNWDFYRLTDVDIRLIESWQEGQKWARLMSQCNRTDHDHKTGLIRGRLDWKINYGLGLLGDDPITLRLLADYLEDPPAPHALGRKVYGLIGQAKYKRKMVYGGDK